MLGLGRLGDPTHTPDRPRKPQPLVDQQRLETTQVSTPKP